MESSTHSGLVPAADAVSPRLGARELLEEACMRLVVATASSTGMDFLRLFIEKLGALTGARYLFVSEFTETRARVRTLAFWKDDHLDENIEFDLEGTPCTDVLQGRVCFYPTEVARLFPKDPALQRLGIQSYVGVPMRRGEPPEVLGHIAVFHDRPLDSADDFLTLLEVFSGRIATELDRARVERELQRRLELESSLAAISSEFLRTPSRDMPTALSHVAEHLRHIGRWQSCAFYLGEADGSLARAVVSARPGDGHRGIRCSELARQWIVSHFDAESHLAFSSLAELPDDAHAYRAHLERAGVRNALQLPVREGNQLLGFISLENCEPEERASEDLALYHLASELIGSAIVRRNQQELLERANVNLETLVEERTGELRVALGEVERLKERLQQENAYLQEEVRAEWNFEGIVGRSPELRKVLSKIEQVAPTETTVLLVGETGTGKELFARALHQLSARSARPMVKVNCAALSPQLIESELFGHERGAFTGAFTRRVGRFELANGTTLFLDEIGELSMELQAKLLRVVQEREFERVGGTQTLRTDARIVAATNRDLKRMVADGDFREDLYYRMSVFPIHLPPLRCRRDDIELLARHFLEKFARNMGKAIRCMPAMALDALRSYDWPGNIRELENVIERAVIVSEGDSLMLPESMEMGLGAARPTESAPAPVSPTRLEDMEREHIVSMLEKTRWKVSGPGGAAERLGMNASTLRSRMKKLGIARR